jgi:hypothetical protein
MLYTSLLCLTAPLLSNSFQRTNRNLGNDAPPVASVRNNRIRSAAPSDRRIGLQSYTGAPKGRGRLQPCSSHSRGADPGRNLVNGMAARIPALIFPLSSHQTLTEIGPTPSEERLHSEADRQSREIPPVSLNSSRGSDVPKGAATQRLRSGIATNARQPSELDN